jgi:thymidine kinase
MYSGKSSLLINKLEEAQLQKKEVCLVRSTVDTRPFLSHDNINYEGRTFISDSLFEIEDLLKGMDIIGIDEGQFLEAKIILDYFLTHDVEIVITALNGTSEQNPWDTVSALLPHTTHIIKLNAKCSVCNKEAPYSFHKEGKTNTIEIGADKYTALCGNCLISAQLERKIEENNAPDCGFIFPTPYKSSLIYP